MKSLVTTLAFAIVSVCAFGSKNPDYQFTIVAQTGQPIGNYVLAELGSPAINNRSDVIFTGFETPPIGPPTPFLAGLFSPEGLLVPANGALPSCFGPYILNDSGQIAFVEDSKIGPTQPYVSGVYESNLSGEAVQTIVAPGAVVDGVQLVGNICGEGSGVSFNNSGRVAFPDTGGVYKFTPKKGLVKIDITKVDGQTVTGIIPVNGTPEKFLFQASTATFQGIFTRDQLVLRTGKRIDGIAPTLILGPVASHNGQLAFLGSFGAGNPGQYAIFTKDSVVAKGGERISGLVISSAGQPFLSWAVNDQGEVVFDALVGTNPGNSAIFSKDAVIVAVGDSINGHTVASVGAPAINNLGVIAFLASFSDGTTGVVLARPRWRL